MKPKRTVKMPLRRPAPKPRSSTPKMRARAATADYDLEDYEEETGPNMRFSHAVFVVLVLHVIAVAGVFAFNSIKARQVAAGGGAEVSASKAEAAAVARLGGAAAASARQEGTHTVVAGDTLTRIAALHGTTVEALEKENSITTYSTIRVGQVLRIPKGSTKPAAPKPIPARVIATTSKSVAAAKPASSAKAPASPGNFTAVTKPANTEPAPTAASGKTPETYTVEKGDNPYSIARKFGVSYQKLIEINSIEDPTKIQIGQILKLPAN
jgi:LysM repeat protein